MKDKIKKIIGKKKIFYCKHLRNIKNKVYENDNKILGIIKSSKNAKVYYNKNKGIELKNLLKNVEIQNVSTDNRFYYNIDFFKTICSPHTVFGNLCIDYSIILENSLEDLKSKLDKSSQEFYENELYTIEAMELLIDRIINKIKNEKIIENISNIKNKKASTLYEALQRILFINMLLWQTNHRLNGLGRLDKILIKYYDNDIKNNIITKREARELIKEFLLELHRFYKIKSNVLLGDTGQIIELGGKNIDGRYECNELTYIFIELMEELKLPDPKVLLRVSKEMPRDLMKVSLKCIQTGIGCPLFANDDVIIDRLKDFGYEEDDVYNYGTSACWEPYLIGKSSAQNNIKSLTFMIPFNDMFEKENLSKVSNTEELLKIYKKYLKNYIEKIIDEIKEVDFEKDTLLSLFIDDCVKNSTDIADGGAKYNDLGLTGVGLANVVNSICNIEEVVFKNKEMSLEELNKIRKENFDDNNELLKRLKNTTNRYGKDNEYVVKIANEIIRFASDVMKDRRNKLGGKYKFGLSSPNYIMASKDFLASFDGRKVGEPFAVHISTDTSDAYTELMEFASKLDYKENRFNGNVVDFFVTPNFINDNFEKFVDFLMLSIKVGFFEMQMNVVSSEKLIEARKNPEKFPNLVVRVWGFSAYFKDLPDEYKDYLIERALKNESSN